MEAPRIMFVDDEVNILHSLRRGLRLHCRDWEVKYCRSPGEALELLTEFKPDVFVSDKRMPDMDGIALLRVVSQRAPETIRVLLTGDGSTEVVLEAADVAHVLISKPFEMQNLILRLRQCVCLKKLPVSLAMRKRLGAIEHIPVLPKVYQQLVEYLKSDTVETKEIARLISLSPSILAKLLQLANSAFMGFSKPISNAHDVVVRLGTNLITNMVLYFGLFEQCQYLNDQVADQLFDDAMSVALLSQQFSITTGIDRVEIDDSFVLGLMHNIGMLISYSPAVKLVEESEDASILDQDAIGAYMLALWEFDAAFINAMLYQNKLEQQDPITPLLCRLHIASVVHHAHKADLDPLDESAGLNRELLASQELLDDAVLWISGL